MSSKNDTDEPVLVPYPDVPEEAIYNAYSLFRGVMSKHTADLRVLVVVGVMVITGIVAGALGRSNDSDQRLFWRSDVIAAFVASLTGSLGAAYQIGKRRFATVDLFSSEILVRMRLLAVDRVVDEIIAAYDKMPSEGELQPGDIERSPENFFSLFEQRAGELGSLSSSIVDHVTDYYNYHKSIRNDILSLNNALRKNDESGIRDHILSLLHKLDLLSFSAFKSLSDLIERPIHRLFAWQITGHVGSRANAFLLEELDESDIRYREILYRRRVYSYICERLEREGNLKRLRRRYSRLAD